MKKGISVWYMRDMQGAPHALQCPGISITSSGAVYRCSRASVELPCSLSTTYDSACPHNIRQCASRQACLPMPAGQQLL